jgi:hypothetical protein
MYNLSNFSKLDEVFSTEEKDLSRNGHYGKFYHNSGLSVLCPRCQKIGELIEDGRIRSLYRCPDCGIFAKLTHKKQATDGKPIKCRLKNPCQGCGGSQGIITEVDRTDCQIPTKKPQLLLLAAVLSSPKKEIKNVQLP